MRPITITVPATGALFTTDPVVLDPYTNPQSTSIIVNTPTQGAGVTATIQLQLSNDDPFAPNFTSAGAVWLSLPLTTFTNGGIVTPTNPVISAVLTSVPRIVRFLGSSCVGNPVVSFKIVQGGLTGV